MSKTKWQDWIELSFSRVFSDKNKNTIERFTINVSIFGFIIHLLLISIFGFIIHLLLILGKKYDVFHSRIDNILLTDPISAIYTPFSIILIYEIYLLIHYLPRSFTTSVSKQFEIISLIVIRRIFADIPHIEITASWLNSPSNLQLIYDLIGILILFFLIFLFNKSRNKIMPSRLTNNLRRFVGLIHRVICNLYMI